MFHWRNCRRLASGKTTDHWKYNNNGCHSKPTTRNELKSSEADWKFVQKWGMPTLDGEWLPEVNDGYGNSKGTLLCSNKRRSFTMQHFILWGQTTSWADTLHDPSAQFKFIKMRWCLWVKSNMIRSECICISLTPNLPGDFLRSFLFSREV